MSTGHRVLGDEGDKHILEVVEQSSRFSFLVWSMQDDIEEEIEIGDAAALRALADRLHQIASYTDGGKDPLAHDVYAPAAILKQAVSDCRDDEVRDLLLELQHTVERGEPRHHKDGSRCYSAECGRAHRLTRAIVEHAPQGPADADTLRRTIDQRTRDYEAEVQQLLGDLERAEPAGEGQFWGLSHGGVRRWLRPPPASEDAS